MEVQFGTEMKECSLNLECLWKRIISGNKLESGKGKEIEKERGKKENVSKVAESCEYFCCLFTGQVF